MKALLRIAITGVALWAAIWLVPGLDFSGSFWMFLGVTLVVLAANAIAKPLINLFSMPFIILTLGLFLLVTNALALQLAIWLSSSVFELGLTSEGFFWSTFLGALAISVVSTILHWVLPD